MLVQPFHSANRGDMNSTAKHIEQNVYIHHHSAEKPLQTHAPIKSRLLTLRQHDEVKPFYRRRTSAYNKVWALD